MANNFQTNFLNLQGYTEIRKVEMSRQYRNVNLHLLEFLPGDVTDQVPGFDVLGLVSLELDHARIGALLEILVLKHECLSKIYPNKILVK
jgi:hypothetical protein